MSSEEREAYLIENKDKGNKRYVDIPYNFVGLDLKRGKREY